MTRNISIKIDHSPRPNCSAARGIGAAIGRREGIDNGKKVGIIAAKGLFNALPF